MPTNRSIVRVGQTVNNKLLDSTVRHSVHLEHFKNGEVNDVVSFLNRDVVPDLLKQTESRLKQARQRGFDTGPWTTQRLREITLANDSILRAGMRTATGRLEGSLSRLAMGEAEWQRGVLSAALPIEINLNLPNSQLLQSIVSSRPMEGRVLKEWFSSIATKTGESVTRQIQMGTAAGESVDQIMARLRGTSPDVFHNAFGTGTMAEMNRNARSVVRTAVNHTTTQAKEATYLANADVLKGVQIVATLDSRTTEICMGEDGKIYPLGEGPRPPFHFQCRTTTVPVTKSWKEMGIPLKDTKNAGARASMNGQVSDKLDYGDWLKKQPKDFQVRALGKSKAELFREGKVTVDQFVNDAGKVLTLQELKLADELGEFGALADALPIDERISEVRKLIERLDAATDAAEKKTLRAKLRRLDEDWQKYRTVDPPPLLPINPVLPPPPPPSVPSVQPHVNLPDIEPKVKVTNPVKTGAEVRQDMMAKVEPVIRKRDELGQQANEVAQKITQESERLRNRAAAGLDSSTANSNMNALYDEYNKILGEARKVSESLSSEAHKALRVDDPLDMNFTGLDILSTSMKKKASEASNFLASTVSKNAFPSSWLDSSRRMNVKVHKNRGRAFHRDGEVYLSLQDPTSVYIHEVGHALEFRDKDWAIKARAYLRKRAAGEGTQSMRKATGNRGYRPDEVTYKDKWDNPYTGKYYSSGSTEITSMGLEWLYNDPVGFARKDPEFFEFIIDLVRGNLNVE